MWRFQAHLRSVNEGYFQHMRHALSFTGAMLVGAVCCLIHGFFPFLFEKRGSSIIKRLHDSMVVNRHRLSAAAEEGAESRTPAEMAVVD